jgi:predicted ATPase
VRELGGDFEGLSPGAKGTADPESARFRLFDAAGRFLVERASVQPLVVLLDDLHAADTASLVLLRFVSERESQLHERPELFAELARFGPRLSLQGLELGDVEAYVERVTGQETSRSAATRLHVLSGGNPFFLGQVLRLVDPDGLADELRPVPEEVRVLLRRRLADLSPDAVAVLGVASVAGREFQLKALERTTDLGVARLLDVLDEAGEAGVIAEDPALPRRYAFVHELVRETLYEDLAPALRLELHARFGAVLQDAYRDDLDPHLSEIARHLAAAVPLGDTEAAIDFLVRAGDRAADQLAYEEAGVHYERALAPPGKPPRSAAASCCSRSATRAGARATCGRRGRASRRRPTWRAGSTTARRSPAPRSATWSGSAASCCLPASRPA